MIFYAFSAYFTKNTLERNSRTIPKESEKNQSKLSILKLNITIQK